MADERDQKSARDVFDDAQRPDGIVFHTMTAKAEGADRVRDADAEVDDYYTITMENVDRTDETDLAPGRESVTDSIDEQPEGDGILSSLGTFEELRVGDEIPDPLTGKALCNNEVVEEPAGSDALIDGGVHRIDLDDGHNPDDGSIMFET